eukprot:SAG31_NODE_565_length_14056_cov_22.573189_1_plen_124_part_00
MRVAICTVGTRGDVQPLLAIAHALQEDHSDSVVICTNDCFADWISGLGLTFASAGVGKIDQSLWSSFGSMDEFASAPQHAEDYPIICRHCWECTQKHRCAVPSVRYAQTGDMAPLFLCPGHRS